MLRPAALVCAGALLLSLAACKGGDDPAAGSAPLPETEQVTPTVTPEPTPEPTPESTPTPTPEPTPTVYTLSFAGDCTLGTEYSSYGSPGSFVYEVGDKYDYPFENVVHIFESDDFTMVNFEGVLSEYNVPAEKQFRFRAPPAYSAILTAGDVEAVNLANNHSYDYGRTGYADTRAALEQEGITYVESSGTALYTTESGLKIGLFASQFNIDTKAMKKGIQTLREQGAEVIVTSFHWGVEGSYRPTADQKNFARMAIDSGADIVFGHHPHVLQPIEYYNDGVIYYSLGNFSFGGNRNPDDKDTAIIQQTVIRELDGTVHLGETTPIPCSLSSTSGKNDYRPIPYEVDSDKYERTMTKLNGTFTGPDLVRRPAATPEPTPEPTETLPVETAPLPTETVLPEETAPVETQPVETQPVETIPVETQPVETAPAETQPAETAPVESVPEIAPEPEAPAPAESEAGSEEA